MDKIDCACVIHGNAYDWQYVDRLYSMLSRNLSWPVKLHVYTEASRPVPQPYVKHDLEDWGITGPKKSWWYKMQLFNSRHHAGRLLYFDLDTVIVKNIDWIVSLGSKNFWTIKDFKWLWKTTNWGINSSVMSWDTTRYHWIWDKFRQENLTLLIRKYPGDQDYISAILGPTGYRFFDENLVKSWRWQCLDGGYDFKRRAWKTPGAGTNINDETSILVLHGKPKPHQIHDPVIVQHWQ